MTNWAILIYGLLAIVALVGVATEEVRARITHPGRPGPLSGMPFSDTVTIVLYIAAIMLGLINVIHLVLTR